MSSYAVILTSHLPRQVPACWVLDDEKAAREFAAFVTEEIDPAIVVRAGDPVKELLAWRESEKENPR